MNNKIKKILMYSVLFVIVLISIAVMSSEVTSNSPSLKSGITTKILTRHEPQYHLAYRIPSNEVNKIDGNIVYVSNGTQINCSDYPRLGPRSGRATFISMDGSVGASFSPYAVCSSSEGGSTESYFTGDIRFYYPYNYQGLNEYRIKTRFYLVSSCDDVEYFPISDVVTKGHDVVCSKILETKEATHHIPLSTDPKTFEKYDSHNRGYNTLSANDICGYGEDMSFFQPHYVSGGHPLGSEPYYSDATITGTCAKVQKTTYRMA